MFSHDSLNGRGRAAFDPLNCAWGDPRATRQGFHGLPPVPERPTSWQTFFPALWCAIAGVDFFTTEVWTCVGLVTFYTLFVIDLASRRVEIVGSTPHPHDLFTQQVTRTLSAADDG